MNKFLKLLVFIEDQKWSMDRYGYIRNRKGQCPICAIVDVLSNGAVSYLEEAETAWTEYIGPDARYDHDDLVEFIDLADTAYYHWQESYAEHLREVLHVQE